MAEHPSSHYAQKEGGDSEPAKVGPTFEELRTSEKLPSPQGVALEIMRLTAKQDATLQEVARLIQLDPALTGRLIEFANSSLTGSHRPVAAVIDAAALLGMGTVRQFALSLSVVSGNLTGACREFGYQAFWTESLARALAAQFVTMRERTVPPAEAFTCALLSEIGRLALASVYPEEYSACLAEFRGAGDDALVAAESERFSIDHRQMTLGLLRDWGFPGVLLDATALHLVPAKPSSANPARAERFAQQLRFAALLGRFCAVAEAERGGYLSLIFQSAHGLGLSEADLADIWSQVSQEWLVSSRLFNLSYAEIPPLTQAAVEDHGTADPGDLPGFKVLLVIDDLAEAERLARLLTADGHQVTTARYRDEGLRSVVRDRPQVILAAAHKSPADAIPLCRALRSSELAQSVYLMLLARSADEEFQVQALESGIDDVALLPISDRLLCARVRGGRRLIQLHAEMACEQRKMAHYVKELAIAKRKLEAMAMTDMLTNIPNRRYAFARLHEEWAGWRRTGRPLTLMIADMDYFKQINDRLGHQVGDKVLAHAAKIIRLVLRATDVVCRLGGEEFVVIAPNTDRLAAGKLGERLRKEVEREQCGVAGLPRPLTISVGVAVSDHRAGNEDDLLHQADQALYRAKRAGRNNVQFF
jgi:diguanylate cyclase (GGDEF)-like protein